ncbi:hypothetical protein [Streptomyces nogalater]|uniref:Secreted protein n=1 Tax=Streptomyces nogalater TaxID=38314 RepID=A0ABW0WEN6_STRNO
MSAVREIITSVLSAAVLAGGLAVAAAGPASAATCPSSSAPVVDGAKAAWSLRCSGNKVTVAGWVEDTRADTKCAVVRVNAGNGAYKTKSACGSGVREQFSYTFAGTKSAQVRLAIA